MKTQLILTLLLLASLVQGQAQTVDSVLTNRLAEPFDIEVEANVYYITDSANDRVVRFVPDTGVLSTLAGFAGRPGSTDAKGVLARFSSPRGVVSVPARSGLVVADYGNHTLRLVKLDGTVTTLAGSAGLPGPESGSVSAGSARFNFPAALAADEAGNVFIADTKNNAIRKLDLANLVSTVATGLSEPNGLAVGDNGDLWISDTRNHTIKRRSSTGAIQLAAGIPGQSGYLDSIFSSESLFNNPTALIWLGSASGLLVVDSGNHALRRVYYDPEIAGYSVETFAGSPPQPGFVNGSLRQAKFRNPAGISKDPTGGFLIADLGNNAIRRVQTSSPQPPVKDPVLGYVTFEKDSFGELLSKLVPVSQAVFNNDVTIAILSEPATETYYTFGPTPPSNLEDTIPSPNRLTGNSPPTYKDGLHVNEVASSILTPQPDLTVKVIGSQDGRRPSSVVEGRFQFKTANPSILGDNAALFVITNITAGAQMWYTTDGSEPAANSPTSVGIVSGQVSLLRSASPITLKVRAFRDNYKPSETTTKVFLPDDFRANRISFGFENGEASSEFVASPGQTFFAPVTLSLLPNQSIYTLQFNVDVKSVTGPEVTPGAVGFESMLMWQIGKDTYVPIPPAMFTNDATALGNLQLTNAGSNLILVGWLERLGKTNLYDSTLQDLITYSIAHDNIFLKKDQKVVVGGYTFVVPGTATPGDSYQIQIGRPSATSDGIGRDNFIEAVTDGTLTSSPENRMNSIKIVTVNPRQYIVGDAAPFRWFNAGDFGEGLLLNNDALQVFQSAIYLLNYPPKGSDLFDAMDSSNGYDNNLFGGNDLSINNITLGDGSLNVDDVYVTFRRALDPSLTWYARSWQNGVRIPVPVPNVFRPSPDSPGERLTASQRDLPGQAVIPGEPNMTFAIDDAQVIPGQSLEIPIRSRIVGVYPARVLMLNLSVEPLDGAPRLTDPVQFGPAEGLGQPTLTTSRGQHNFAGAWLNSKVTGVLGNAELGRLKITIPTNAAPTAAYRVHFDHASASPNGLALFPKEVTDGVLALKDRTGSTWADGIPDTWRLRYFGSISNLLADASADADGDGMLNLAEFKAGTNPTDPHSHLGLAARRGAGAANQQSLTLRWPSAINKQYTIEAAPSLMSTTWTILGSGLTGTGGNLEFTPSDLPDSIQFFRVRLSEPQ